MAGGGAWLHSRGPESRVVRWLMLIMLYGVQYVRTYVPRVGGHGGEDKTSKVKEAAGGPGSRDAVAQDLGTNPIQYPRARPPPWGGKGPSIPGGWIRRAPPGLLPADATPSVPAL